MTRVLVVDDDAELRGSLRRILRGMGCDVVEAGDGVEAIGKLSNGAFDLVLTDLRMPRADGFAVLSAVRDRSPGTPAIMLTAQGGINDCVSAIKAGASDFLTKPFHPSTIEDVVRRAISGAMAGAAPTARRPQVTVVGNSARLQEVLDVASRVATTDATVLITGETGTGKEVIARLIHSASPRSAAPFIAVNCGAIPENLIESELFGHARGAFTGATERRVGTFVRADGGTLFLDEIGDLPPPAQVKLLRVLQERQITPVGDGAAVAVDVRIVAATHRDLEAMVNEGRFRQDLLYRLAVVPLAMPALRERADDIPALASHFLTSSAQRLGRPLRFSDDLLGTLATYRWPGNVRELENLVERLAILCRGDVITVDQLPASVRVATATAAATAATAAAAAAGPGGTTDVMVAADADLNLPSTLERIEDELIREALRRAAGNKAVAARILGINRTTLVEKLKRRPLE